MTVKSKVSPTDELVELPKLQHIYNPLRGLACGANPKEVDGFLCGSRSTPCSCHFHRDRVPCPVCYAVQALVVR